MAQASEIRYLTPPSVEIKKKKYCRFRKNGIKYVDYKDPEFLKKFLNEQGKILPRRITGTSLKYQRKVGQAIKRARQIANGADPMVQEENDKPTVLALREIAEGHIDSDRVDLLQAELDAAKVFDDLEEELEP